MRRCLAAMLMVSSLACSPMGSEPPSEPEPERVASKAVAPAASEPAPAIPPVVAMEPEPAMEQSELVTEPEPEPVVVQPWATEDERRILAVQPFVADAAAAYEVDPYLVNGLVWVESKFKRKAKNRSGARGLMQLMPTTAKALGRALHRPAKIYDAEFSVHAGTYYLSRQLKRFEGDERLALAAYARGPGKVRGWIENGESLPASVERFVAKVQRARDAFAAVGWPEPPEVEPMEAAADDDGVAEPTPVAQ